MARRYPFFYTLSDEVFPSRWCCSTNGLWHPGKAWCWAFLWWNHDTFCQSQIAVMIILKWAGKSSQKTSLTCIVNGHISPVTKHKSLIFPMAHLSRDFHTYALWANGSENWIHLNPQKDGGQVECQGCSFVQVVCLSPFFTRWVTTLTWCWLISFQVRKVQAQHLHLPKFKWISLTKQLCHIFS